MLVVGPDEWGLRGDLLVEARIAGRSVSVLARFPVDRTAPESCHVRASGPLSRRQLSALAMLPPGIPIKWREVDFDTRVELDTLPAGALEVTQATVTRLWQPPVEVVCVASLARHAHGGIEDVSLFSSVAPRVVRVSERAQVPSEVLTRAEHLGVGVYRSGEGEALTRPPSRRQVSDDARRWEVAEVAYRGAIRGGVKATSMPAPVAN